MFTPNGAWLAGHCYPIDDELSQMLVFGDGEGFHQAVSSKQLDVCELRCPNDSNTVLHIAAIAGQTELVLDLLNHWPQLMVLDNSQGSLAIHSALEFRKVKVVEALTCWLQGNINTNRNLNVDVVDHVLGWKNKEGKTALYLALENDQHDEIARNLVHLYPQACYLMNLKGVCPLYLAIDKDLSALVRHMLRMLQPFTKEARSVFRQGNSLLHAAVSARGEEILEEVLSYDPLLLFTFDGGRTPLSCAACLGDLVKVQLLLKAFPDSASLRDDNVDGTFPIHHAVRGGHVSVVENLKNTKYLTNARGHNILHVAVQTGNSNLVASILKMPEVDSLINQKDEKGNTPLHLATMLTNHPEDVVDILLQDQRVNIGLSNKYGSKAVDLVKDLASSRCNEDIGGRLMSLMLKRRQNLFRNDSEFCRLLVNGDIDRVLEIVSEVGLQLWDIECLDDKSNVLHIAASMDDLSLVSGLLKDYDCGRLMLQANNKGDRPLHTAAKAGKLSVLKDLFELGNVPSKVCGQWQDGEGNTPLHIALLNCQKEMTLYLLNQCPQAALCLNKDKICPLFLAIKDDFWDDNLVKEMTELTLDLLDTHDHSLFKDAKSILHAAIFFRGIDIFQIMIERAPSLLDSVDSRGRSVLSYAAYIGCDVFVQLLLEKYPDIAFRRDKDVDESFPIHQAAKGGNIEVMKVFCSFKKTTWLLNGRRQNILHVAAKTGCSMLIAYLLKKKEFKELINVGDEDGNTPLHLAVQCCHAQSVFVLTLEDQLDETAMNKDGFIPRDMSVTQSQYKGLHFEEHFIKRIMLRPVVGSKFLSSKKEDYQEKEGGDEKAKAKAASSRRRKLEGLLNTLLLVATLFVALTVAAGFAPPGGYNQSNPDIGMATLVHKTLVQIFVICNTLAFHLSIGASIVFINGIRAIDVDYLVFRRLKIGGFLLTNALILISVAFTTGVLVTVENLPWLRTLVIFSVSILAVLLYVVGNATTMFLGMPLPRTRMSTWWYIANQCRCRILLPFCRGQGREAPIDYTI